MSLEEKLAAIRKAAEGRIPADKHAIMHRATEDLRRSGIMERIVAAGGPAPSFDLANHDGHHVSSAALLARGPTIVSFFRGSW